MVEVGLMRDLNGKAAGVAYTVMLAEIGSSVIGLFSTRIRYLKALQIVQNIWPSNVSQEPFISYSKPFSSRRSYEMQLMQKFGTCIVFFRMMVLIQLLPVSNLVWTLPIPCAYIRVPPLKILRDSGKSLVYFPGRQVS